jgi:hypothetical protein
MIKIGNDFPKITWQFYDFKLLEPNAFFGDLIISLVAMYYGFKIYQIYKESKNKLHLFWFWFFILTSLTFLFGGLGHLLYNYWGIKGKYFSWYIGLFSMFMLEMAILNYQSSNKRFGLLFSFFKLAIIFSALTFTINVVNLEKNPMLGLVIPFIHSFLGMTYFCGYQSHTLSKNKNKDFIYCFYSYLLIFPIIILQSLKININQWFDRNDFSHLLLIISLILISKTARIKIKKLNT